MSLEKVNRRENIDCDRLVTVKVLQDDPEVSESKQMFKVVKFKVGSGLAM